jgi:hypothetical protein
MAPNGKPRSAQRSRVANGTALLDGVDGRSVWVRRAKETIADLTADAGGADRLSTAEHSIIRRAATLTVELELLEKQFAVAGTGAPIDLLDAYQRASNSLRRLLEAVGLQRRMRPVDELDPIEYSRRYDGGGDA